MTKRFLFVLAGIGAFVFVPWLVGLSKIGEGIDFIISPYPHDIIGGFWMPYALGWIALLSAWLIFAFIFLTIAYIENGSWWD